MIWFMENGKVSGYVPVINQEFSNEDIRDISNLSSMSSLAKFICLCKGISFCTRAYGSHNSYLEQPPKRLIDIKYDFSDLECFSNIEKTNSEYIKAIFNVFENLALYKVHEFDPNESKELVSTLEGQIEAFLKSFEKLTTCKIKASIDAYEYSEFLRDIATSEKNSSAISNLLKLFDKHDLEMNNCVFKTDESFDTSSFYENRSIRYSDFTFNH